MKNKLQLAFLSILLLLIPKLNFGQTPNLGACSSFTLFTAGGAFTNTGASAIIGDIGTHVGAFTGFPPGTVTGTIHVADATTSQAATDAGTAYGYLSTLSCDSVIGVTLGNNQVLTPKTYCTGAASTLNDTLYLNGLGNPNAIFIFKINGALATSNYAQVILINGASLCNVYWQINGAFTLTDYSIFRGNVIGGGAVNIYIGAKLYGRAITTAGAITLNAMSAEVPFAPIITTEPINQTVCAGGSVSFSVIATGTGLTYQWRKGNANIAGANSSTLVINPVTVNDTASNYNVIVSSTCSPSDTSNFVSLTVNTAPLITTEPVNQTVCAGGSVSFSVIATGTGLTYQWRKGNANIAGANSSTLVINPVTVNDTASNYNVIVSGTCAPSDTSNFVSLTVNTAPLIITEPVNQTVCAGGSVSFSVIASGTGLTYQWLKGTANIAGANSSTLTINPVTVNDTASNYNVIVSGTCAPSDTSNFVSLTVNTAPLIITEPVNQTVCAGGSVSFSVISTGTGLTYQWRKGNSNIAGANSSTLVINPVTVNDTASNYNVIVSGTCSPGDTSNFVSLTVNTAPIIITEPVNQTVCAGGSVSFSVIATGTGLTYQWRKGNANIAGANSSTLVINSVTVNDTASNYNVIVSGTCSPSDISNFVSLTVYPIPVATAGSNSPVCESSTINLTAQFVAGATYQWTGPGAFTSSAQNPIILSASPSKAGVYSLIVSANGCSSPVSSITIVVKKCDSADLSIIKTVDKIHPLIGGTVIFTIKATNNGPNMATGVVVNDILPSGYAYISATTTLGIYDAITGIWNVGTMLNGSTETLTITARVNATGNYLNTSTITGIEPDKNLADNISTAITNPVDFFIPEGFSPNNDGVNDLFVIRGIENYPENTFVIYNRWGNKVFETSHYENTWDGRSTTGLRVGGDVLPVGTYFYILDLGNGSGIIKGTIYLNK